MFVLGIDPGLSRCGYGVIKIGKPKEKAVSAGVIRTSPNEVTSVRLFEIRNEIQKNGICLEEIENFYNVCKNKLDSKKIPGST